MSYGAIGAVSATNHSAHPVQITDKHLIAAVFVALVAVGIYLAVDKKSGLGGALAGVSALGGTLFAAVEYRKMRDRSEHSSLREWLANCGYQGDELEALVNGARVEDIVTLRNNAFDFLSEDEARAAARNILGQQTSEEALGALERAARLSLLSQK